MAQYGAVNPETGKFETAPRIAGFSPMQQKAQDTAYNMGTSGQLGTGTGLATAAGLMGLGANYQPGYFGNQFRAPAQYQPSQFGMMSAQAPDLQQFQMDPFERVQGEGYNVPLMDTARTNYRPDIQAFQMDAVEDVGVSPYTTPEMTAAQTDFNPNLQQYRMGPAERAEAQSFTQPGSAEAYMSPFMQNVVDKQTREAERQAGLAAKQERAASIQRGAFGGGRTAVREAAAARDLAQLKSDIYGTGQQAAFQNAQQQFNAEQQARMQAQLANQQAGLTVGGQNLAAQLGIQQLGTQTGMQTAFANLNNRQQSEVQNQAARLQTQGLSAQQAMQAALANQQAKLTVGQQNLASRQGAQQLDVQTGLQTSLANLTSEQQANVQNQAARLQTQGLTANQAMQAALANQQAGLTRGQQNLAAQLGVQQLGSGQNMQAQLANQQAYQNMLQQREASRQFGYGQQMTAAQQRAQFGQAAQQLAEQSRQFGAGYGQQGLNTALQAAGQLGNLGQAEFGQQKDIVGLQSQLGAQQQALRQQGLSQAYQDFLNEQNYPYKQFGFMSDMIRGLPLGQQTTRQVYEPPGSMMGQLGGIGMGLYGMSRIPGMFAEGGAVDGYADGGSVDSPQNVASIVRRLSDEQLPQAKQAAQARGDYEQLQAIMAEESRRASAEQAMQASERGGLAGAFNQLPDDTQDNIVSAAGGGIVAFAGGGVSPEFGGSDFVAPTIKESSLLQRLLDAPGRAVRGGKSIAEYYGGAASRLAEPSPRPPSRPFVQPLEEEEAAAASRVSKKSQPAARPTQTRARTSSAPSASITQAAAQLADRAGIDKETFLDKFKEVRDELNKSSKEEMKSLLAEAEKSMGGSKEVKERAIGEAFAKYGFEVARAAAKPGAKFFSSFAEAAPTLSASLAENAKLAREMDQNDMKLRMNLKQFEIAQRKGDMQTAATLAGQVRALEQAQAQIALQREQLAETSRANRARETIAGRKAASTNNTALRAFMTGQNNALNRAQKLAKDEWGDLTTRKDLAKKGITSYSQLYDYHKQRELKNIIPISNVTTDDSDED
jgi:hypothetical protein